MSRAARASTVMVAGFSVRRSVAHAASGPIVMPAAATATAAGPVAAPRRKTRRRTEVRLSTSLISWFLPVCFLAVVAEALQHLRLVAIRIGDEEEARERLAVVRHVAHRPGR